MNHRISLSFMEEKKEDWFILPFQMRIELFLSVANFNAEKQ